MPTYEYRCSGKCSDFEYFQSIHDDALSACPVCKLSVSRLISRNVGIQFSGSGFYANDAKAVPTKKSGSDSKGSASKKPK